MSYKQKDSRLALISTMENVPNLNEITVFQKRNNLLHHLFCCHGFHLVAMVIKHFDVVTNILFLVHVCYYETNKNNFKRNLPFLSITQD